MIDKLPMLLKIAPIILLILLGMTLRKIHFVSPQTIDDLKKIILNISLPAMLFTAFAGTQFSSQYLGIIAAVFLACLVMLLLASPVLRCIGVENPFMPALFVGFETGMIGYSLFVATYGQQEMFKLAIIDLGQALFVFLVLIPFINRQNGITTGGLQLIQSFFKSPVILAILFGITFSLTGLTSLMHANPNAGFVFDCLALLSNLTVPMITIAIGYELRLNKDTFRGPLLVAAVRLAILIGFAYVIDKVLIVGLLHLDRFFELALFTMFILPPPFVVPIIMREKKSEHRQFILNTISIHIVLSAVAFLGVIVIL
jgi:predicted permease